MKLDMQRQDSIIPGCIEIGDQVSDHEDWNWNDRGYHFVAQIVIDEDHQPDDFDEGSIFDMKDDEYGERNTKIQAAWVRNDWQYFGVTVKAYRCGLELGDNSLWGIEGNFTYEGREGPVDNTHFNEIMQDCAYEAAAEAKHKIHELMASLLNIEYAPRAQRDDGVFSQQQRRKGNA